MSSLHLGPSSLIAGIILSAWNPAQTPVPGQQVQETIPLSCFEELPRNPNPRVGFRFPAGAGFSLSGPGLYSDTRTVCGDGANDADPRFDLFSPYANATGSNTFSHQLQVQTSASGSCGEAPCTITGSAGNGSEMAYTMNANPQRIRFQVEMQDSFRANARLGTCETCFNPPNAHVYAGTSWTTDDGSGNGLHYGLIPFQVVEPAVIDLRACWSKTIEGAWSFDHCSETGSGPQGDYVSGAYVIGNLLDEGGNQIGGFSFGASGDAQVQQIVCVEPGNYRLETLTMNSGGDGVSLGGTIIREVDSTTYGTIHTRLQAELRFIRINLQIDSNNDVAVNDDDDVIENEAPGKLIALNDDDDDQDEHLDYEEFQDSTPGEDDLSPMFMQIRPLPANSANFQWKLYIWPGVKVWKKLTREEEIVSGQPYDFPLPNWVYVEGVETSHYPGDMTIQLILVPRDNPYWDLCKDQVVVTVVKVDLDVDSDNDHGCPDFAPDRTEQEELYETLRDKPGRLVAMNDDFDEQNVKPGCVLGNCERAGDLSTPAPISANGDALITEDMVPLIASIEPFDNLILDHSEIKLRQVSTGSGRIIAVNPSPSVPFNDDWVEVPANRDLSRDFFLPGGRYQGWNWFFEGQKTGISKLEFQLKKVNTVLKDRVQLYVSGIKFFRVSSTGVRTSLTDWPAIPSFDQLDSARFPFKSTDELVVRIESFKGLGNGYFSVHVQSEADPGGVDISLDEVAGGVYENRGAELLRLAAESRSASPKTLRIAEEESLRFQFRIPSSGAEVFCSRSVMVDRLEGAGCGIDGFYAHSDQSPLRLLMWNAGGFGDNGDFNVPGNQGALLTPFIQQSGDGMNGESDFLWISCHGDPNGVLQDDHGNVIISPNSGGSDIFSQIEDWNDDMDWVVLAACSTLNNNEACPRPGPGNGRVNWLNAAFGGRRRLHALLGAWCPLSGNLTAQVTDFWNRAQGGSAVVLSYRSAMESGASPEPWATLAISNPNSENDKLTEVLPDIGNSIAAEFYYIRQGLAAGVLCGRQANQEGMNKTRLSSDLRQKLEGLDKPRILSLVSRAQAPQVDLGPGVTVYPREDGYVQYQAPRSLTEVEPTRISEERATQIANAWVAAQLPDFSNTLSIEGVGPTMRQRMTVKGTQEEEIVGYFVNYVQHFNGTRILNRFLRLRIVNDAVVDAHLKLERLPESSRHVDRQLASKPLSALEAWSGVEASVIAAANPEGTIYLLDAGLFLWDGKEFGEPVKLEQPQTMQSIYRFLVADASCDENPESCARVKKYYALVDPITGTLEKIINY